MTDLLVFGLLAAAAGALLVLIGNQIVALWRLHREEAHKKQLEQVERMEKLEVKLLPADIDYDKVSSLRDEAREKLSKIRPISIGQASRISGVSPADISVLLVYLEQQRRQGDLA